jgi:hypothetical protein
MSMRRLAAAIAEKRRQVHTPRRLGIRWRLRPARPESKIAIGGYEFRTLPLRAGLV